MGRNRSAPSVLPWPPGPSPTRRGPAHRSRRTGPRPCREHRSSGGQTGSLAPPELGEDGVLGARDSHVGARHLDPNAAVELRPADAASLLDDEVRLPRFVPVDDVELRPGDRGVSGGMPDDVEVGVRAGRRGLDPRPRTCGRVFSRRGRRCLFRCPKTSAGGRFARSWTESAGAGWTSGRRSDLPRRDDRSEAAAGAVWEAAEPRWRQVSLRGGRSPERRDAWP